MNAIQKKSVNAGNYVSKDEMNTLTSGYKQQRWADNSERMGKADSLSVWFTLEELEGFLENVKANGGDSVRMHFGVVPEGNSIPEFVGRQTIVLIGNRTKDGSYSSSKELFIDNNGQPEVLAYSNGTLCPPFCGSGGGGKGKSALIVRNDNSMEII